MSRRRSGHPCQLPSSHWQPMPAASGLDTRHPRRLAGLEDQAEGDPASVARAGRSDSQSVRNKCVSATEAIECLAQTDRFVMAWWTRAPTVLRGNHSKPAAPSQDDDTPALDTASIRSPAGTQPLDNVQTENWILKNREPPCAKREHGGAKFLHRFPDVFVDEFSCVFTTQPCGDARTVPRVELKRDHGATWQFHVSSPVAQKPKARTVVTVQAPLGDPRIPKMRPRRRPRRVGAIPLTNLIGKDAVSSCESRDRPLRD